MRLIFLKFAELLDRAARIICILAAALLALLVLLNVVLRYGFATGGIALQDMTNYAFAVLLALSVPVCLTQGGHVRVEVFSEMLPPSYLRRADIVALFLFLIPVFGLAVWAYLPELSYSWSIREGSVETGGLGGLFLVKTALPTAAVLMIIQGIAAVLQPPVDKVGGL